MSMQALARGKGEQSVQCGYSFIYVNVFWRNCKFIDK